MTPESIASHTDLLRSMRGVRQTLHFRSLIAGWMSSPPVCVSAGSKVRSVVGQSRHMMVSGARRPDVHHAVYLAVIQIWCCHGKGEIVNTVVPAGTFDPLRSGTR